MGVERFVRKLPERGVRRSLEIGYEWMGRQLWMGDFADETVLEREWDVLVLLDACRVDLMAEVATEYDWLPSPAEIEAGAIDSVAGSSKEWMRRTFTPAHAATLEQTAYVTGNPFSAAVLGDNHPLGLVDEVWRYAWDDDAGSIRPEPITDRAIGVCRDGDFDRVIVHYMQPHVPFLDRPDLHAGYRPDDWGSPDSVVDPDETGVDVWGRVRRGELNRDEVWAAYADNLRVGLDAVATLRRNVDGTLVVSADHGNAMGELGIWGHPDRPVSSVRRVPWIELEAHDEGTRESVLDPDETDTDDRAVDADVQDRLASLGYTE
ncbi:hydrolase [Haloarchaeobius amylolyticus]|uniref:Hydrolase n=1 Tax=Haloarchaeobius amylolyticus TaxID=1198296 RepID=A0ABD6BE20_9EURY